MVPKSSVFPIYHEFTCVRRTRHPSAHCRYTLYGICHRRVLGLAGMCVGCLAPTSALIPEQTKRAKDRRHYTDAYPPLSPDTMPYVAAILNHSIPHPSSTSYSPAPNACHQQPVTAPDDGQPSVNCHRALCESEYAGIGDGGHRSVAWLCWNSCP